MAWLVQLIILSKGFRPQSITNEMGTGVNHHGESIDNEESGDTSR